MTEGHFLAKPHLLSTYQGVANDSRVKGVIYVETDRTIPSVPPPFTGQHPDQSAGDEKLMVRTNMQAWGHEVFEEIRFLRSIVEKGGDEAELLKGVVLYAPMQFPAKVFDMYLSIAEEVAGPGLWERVVGFRYLLQGKKEGEVEKLVSSEEWIGNLITLGEGRGGKGWTFDVGIDINRDGESGLGSVKSMIEEVRKRGSNTRFILSKSDRSLVLVVCDNMVDARAKRRAISRARQVRLKITNDSLRPPLQTSSLLIPLTRMDIRPSTPLI